MCKKTYKFVFDWSVLGFTLSYLSMPTTFILFYFSAILALRSHSNIWKCCRLVAKLSCQDKHNWRWVNYIVLIEFFIHNKAKSKMLSYYAIHHAILFFLTFISNMVCGPIVSLLDAWYCRIKTCKQHVFL
jgi:hypothetical protein